MKIILVLLLVGFAYRYRESIAKIIAAIVLVCIALKLGGEALLAIVITLGAWAAGFGFLCLVTSGPSTRGEYDDLFEEWDKWNRRHHR